MATLTRPVPRAAVTVTDLLRWRPLLAFFATLGVSFMVLALIAATYAALHLGSVFPGVRVDGVDIGGLDRAAAEARLRAQLPVLSTGSLALRVDTTDYTVAYSDLGRDYAMSAMLDNAFAVGRAGSPFEQVASQLRTLVSGVDVTPQITWDEQRLGATLDSIIASATAIPVDAAVARQAAGYVVTPAVVGHRLNLPQVRGLIVASISDPTAAAAAPVSIQTTSIEPRVATSVAQAAVDSYNAATGTTLSVVGGGLTLSVDSATLRNWVDLVPNAADPAQGWTVSFRQEAISAWLTPLAAQIDRQPVEATLTMTDDGVQAVPGVTGQTFDAYASLQGITGLLTARAAGTPQSVAQLAVTTTEPHFTTAAATALASRIEMVSTWTTRFIPGESNFNGENIRVPTRLLNGTVVEAGDTFSFLDAVGEISPARGFGLGGAIIRGHTQEQGAMGGGICSASTTLFNAALRAGYQIVDRTQHAYYISRYPVGLDATVFRSGTGGHDMVFVNDSQYPLWIRGIAGRAKVTFQIWTIPDGRTVKIGKPRIENRHEAEDTVVYVDTLKPGVEKRVEYPVDGFDAWVTRTVYDATGAVIHHETYFSHYITVTGVTQIGIDPTVPPPTEPPPAP